MNHFYQKQNHFVLSSRPLGMMCRVSANGFRCARTFLAAILFLLCLGGTARAQSIGVYREVWSVVSGSSLSSFISSTANFLVPPDLGSEVDTNLFESPYNYGERFGERYRALLVPPVTGNYIFWVQGDDAGQLFLSSDESPANKVSIAYNTNTVLYRVWYGFPSQQSANIFLEAGKNYYIEAIHSAGTGDDAFAVGWKLPDGTLEQPMSAQRMRVFGMPATTKPVISSQPSDLTVLENATARFRIGVSNFDVITYQWQRNGVNLPGAIGATYTLASALTNDSGAIFRCILNNSYGSVTSVTAVLTVMPDTTSPVLATVANLTSNQVEVTFSEPVDAATGLGTNNYALDNGAGVLSATFGSSTRMVLLTTTPLVRDAGYTLTVNNVRDRATSQNLLAANSQQSFVALLKGIYREVFNDVSGVAVSDLTLSPSYPNSPVSAELITDYLETLHYAHNNYGQRLRARVVPPITGSYTFWVSAYDTATLLLGTNGSPSSARPIATVTSLSPLSARQWAVQTNQQSAPVLLTAGQQYYLEVLMKGGLSTGFPADHLSVRWQLPDGTYEEPIPASRLTPHGLNLPLITRQPASTNVVEGSTATFVVAVTNLETIFYQWQQNGTNLPGATNRSYTRSPVALAENGSVFRCLLSNAQGTTNSANATLTVSADTIAPSMSSVVNNSSNRLVITFSEPVDLTTATSLGNYSISNVTLSAPVISSNGLSVTLTTSPLGYGTNYTLVVHSVRDRAVTFNVIATNSSFAFSRVEFFLQDVGTPAPGVLVSIPNGANLTAGNSDFSSTLDSFNYAYQQYRGDFDVKVRVAALDFADTWTTAALMARADLTPGTNYAAVCATPSLVGAFFQYRTNAPNTAKAEGNFPVNYPYTWLRLERVSGVGGSIFHGYAGYDGQTWIKLGTVNLPMPATIYLGFALSSRSATGSATAQFRDFGDNTSTLVGQPPSKVEPPGPTSRRTGLVISEIMYHPASRIDGRSIEFVELYNSNPFYEDISGYRITGDVGYTFPPGTILQGGGILVIAKNPTDLQAVYGIPNVLGPYTNSLSNSKGTVRLRNKSDAILLEVNYESAPPWPVTPDGTGHSLVLARPSYGEDHPEAWSQSGRFGGSPGTVDGLLIEPVGNVMINEFLAHTDLPDVDYVELYNHSAGPVDLSGCWLSDEAGTNKFRIPDGTIIGPTGFVYFTESTLGFGFSALGESIFFVNSNLTRVVDAVTFEGQENGVSSGRSPDGAPTFHRLAAKTPGTPNGAMRLANLVINEIMYNPVSGDASDSFVEVYNRGTNAVNLGGWRFNDGINFTFPTNTIISSNGYLVVGLNVARLRQNYTNLNLTNALGNFSGSLSGNGERIALSMPDDNITTNLTGVVKTNTFYIVMDEVIYGTGGRWGKWSDGGGSSLELIDPRSDNRLPSNWADSDDTAKSIFTTLAVSGTLDNAGTSAGDWNSLQLYLLDGGECLIDNLNVTYTGAVGNQVQNPAFESGIANWFFQGNHRYSYWETNTVALGPTKSLHVVAQDRGDTGANRIYTPLNPLYAPYNTNSIATPMTGTISAGVRWLHGRPEMIFRLRGNHLELAGVMNIPKNLGTPGARNSRFVANAGPALTEIVHTPILPAAGTNVVVTARVHDPDGLASVQLVYRVDPFGGNFTVPMVDNGLDGDEVAGDGVYAGTIPGQAADTTVAFYVQATDSFSPAKTTRFPNDAPARECLVRFGDAQPVANYGTYRFWMTDDTLNAWTTRDKLSSENYPGTMVYGNFRAIYNAGSHYAGSPAHAKLYDSPVGTNCDYQLALPADDALLDETSLRIQEPGLVGADHTGQNESYGYWLINQLGLPALNRRPINMFINGLRRGLIYEDTQRQNSSFDQEWFPDADSDLSDLYRIGYWYEFSDNLLSRSDVPPSLQSYTTTGGVKKLARYRQTFNKRAVKSSPHNYTNLYELVDVLNTTSTGDAYAAEVFPLVDIKEWARAFAAERILNNTDLYGALRLDGPNTKPGAQNSFIFKPGGDSWKFLIWDIDAAFLGTPVDPLFDFTDPPISNMFTHPLVLRHYWQALEDAAYGPLLPSALNSVLDAKYAAYRASSIGVNAPTAMKTYLGTRRDYILQLLSGARSEFDITSNGGNNFTNPSTLVTIAGKAPFAARKITINGVEYPLSWSSVTNWSVRVPLTGPTNQFTVRGYDANGNLLANSTDTITVYFNGLVARSEDSLVINEIMFRPTVTNAQYLEIFNRSTNTTFGLGGYRLKGVDFDFPAASIINPLSYLVVVKDTAAFQSAHGTSPQIAGEYKGDLDKDGETLQLVRIALTTNLADTVISKVKYEIVAPWATRPGATNSGVSLQLIDAAQDVARVSNWDDGFGWKFFSLTGVPTGQRLSLWLDVTNEPVHIDDVRFVHGSIAAVGSNYVKNGDFETNLNSAWLFLNTYQGNSVVTNRFARTGTNSLRFAPTKNGNASTAMYQDMVPTPSSSSNYTVSLWYKPTTTNMNLTVRLGGSTAQQTVNTRALLATPGVANSIVSPVNPYPLLWINEIQPNNTSTLLDNTGTNVAWIEIYNNSPTNLQLGGLSLSKSYTNLSAWTFPSNTVILPGQFRVIFVDGRPQFTTGTVLHTSFKLDGTNGSIVLSRTNQILDYINYTNLHDNESYGDAPDGQLFTRQIFYYPTPGGTNNPSPAPVVINEWMASNTATLVDPFTGTFEDWFELYNFSASPVDLSGYYLTDDLSNKNKWRIPNGITIAPFSFLMCWADGTTSTNTNYIGNALHTNFKISKSGDDLGFYSPTLVKVDTAVFGAQVNNVSQGRYPDGNVTGGYYSMPAPTPRTNNVITANAYPPVLSQPINRVVNEGAYVTFNNFATDGDLPAQPLSFYMSGAPEGAQINPATGLFTWPTTEVHGPGFYTITISVTDNGAPPYTDSKSFTIAVNEVNLAPTLSPIPNQSTYADTLTSVQTAVSDADQPAQTMTYALPVAPVGASVDASGLFTWTPTAVQAPSTNLITLTATDSGTPALSATQSFTVVVNAGIACPGYKGDVVPRGNPNGTNSVADYVQVGLFYARLATVSNACEFARADCAPRPCGNGGSTITITDWVQAGRYAAGLDARVLMGNCPPPGSLAAAPKSRKTSGLVTRTLMVTNTSIARGATNAVAVILEAQGDEGALGFSLRFDTNLLTFIQVRLGADAAGASLLTNFMELSQGLVGVTVGMPIGSSLPAGSRKLVEVLFCAAPGSEVVTTPVQFDDVPISREYSDADAATIEATTLDGFVTLTGGSDFAFKSITRASNGQVHLQMIGVGGIWELQRSSDLGTWQPIQQLTNVTGVLEFHDATATNAGQHFYKAVKK